MSSGKFDERSLIAGRRTPIRAVMKIGYGSRRI
jgi:hypothetical protein